MNKTELKTFAFQLGIVCEKSFRNFAWLMLSFIQEELPDEWVKEMGPDNLTVYYNT